jgi:hypothetical protein
VKSVNGRFFGRALALVLLLVVVGGLGVLAYNAGVSAGISQQAQVVVQDGQPVTVVGYPYGPYWHGGGFGFLGIIFWILGFFLIIGLLRAIFGWGRWGRGGWGKHGYYGYGGPGASGGPGGPGRGFPDGDRVAEWHRELHRRDSGTSGDLGQTPPAAGA